MLKKVIVIIALVIVLLLLTGKAAKIASILVPIMGLGTAKRDFLGRSDLPRGIRNNNPGNLKMTDPQQGWIGSLKRSDNTDGTFEQFTYYEYGLRASLKLVINKIKAGQNTIRRLITAWAPAMENNTESYIRRVEESTGIPQNQIIQATDKESLAGILAAIEFHENGMHVMQPDDFEHAYNLL